MQRHARTTLGLLAILLTLTAATGCGRLNVPGSGVLFPTEDYRVVLRAEGIRPVGPVELGTVPVDANGTGLINLAVLLAGKHLARTADLDGCLFTSYPPELRGSTIVVSASAVCQLDGLPVPETVTLELTPVDAAATPPAAPTPQVVGGTMSTTRHRRPTPTPPAPEVR